MSLGPHHEKYVAKLDARQAKLDRAQRQQFLKAAVTTSQSAVQSRTAVTQLAARERGRFRHTFKHERAILRDLEWLLAE